MMDLRDFRFLEAVAETGSVTRAADGQHLHQVFLEQRHAFKTRLCRLLGHEGEAVGRGLPGVAAAESRRGSGRP